MVFVDRDPEREVKHLAWRVRLFGAGAILSVVGFYFDAGWLIWVAMGVLAVGFALRYVPEPENGPEAGPGHREGE